MDNFLEMDYEDKNGNYIEPDEDDEEYDSDDYDEDEEFHYDSPSLQDTISEWPSYAN